MRVILALMSIGKPAVDPLIEVVYHLNFDIRKGAIETLCLIKDPRAIGVLMQSLKDENKEIRWRAALALGEIGEPAVEPLIMALEDHEVDIQQHAAWCLGKIEEPWAVVPLLNILKSGYSFVRWRAAEALGKIKDERAIEPLIHALEDEDLDVRDAAIESLRNILVYHGSSFIQIKQVPAEKPAEKIAAM
jgi:HEAT repeat protein